MVYVIGKNGKPMMPTERHGKVRHLLKNGKAKVVKRIPFTIQLLYDTKTFVTQDITLGIDPGSKNIGISASDKKKEYLAMEVKPRNDIVSLIATRASCRRTRRNRLKYRPARFNNRRKSKKKGWLPPSVKNKLETHMHVIDEVTKILPIKYVRFEYTNFDIHKLKNPDVSGDMYVHGRQEGYNNVKAYVLDRDNYTCKACKGKSDDKTLHVHHIESRKTGGNAPNNLITLCRTCHTNYHNGKLSTKYKKQLKTNIDKLSPEVKTRDANFMNIAKDRILVYLEEKFGKENVSITYGYITKENRLKHNLKKTHYNDAFAIAGNFNTKRIDKVIYSEKKRRHNRKIHQDKILKGGRLKANQNNAEIHGFRLFDTVKYNGEYYILFGKRKSGFFDIRDLKGNKINKGSISYKKLKLVKRFNGYISEVRDII